MQYVLAILMFLTSLFLILLILVQRGRGGGLAGAFGGMGGQSAFGTKAGDLFTRITIVVAAVWILLSVAAIKILNQSQSVFGEGNTGKSVFSSPTQSDKATKSTGADHSGESVMPPAGGGLKSGSDALPREQGGGKAGSAPDTGTQATAPSAARSPGVKDE